MINITVVVPIYNKANTVLRALNSILYQSFNRYEVIIIDDGSTDHSNKVIFNWMSSLDSIASNKFKLFYQLNSGVSSARNKGVLLAKFEYTAFLDADDYWEDSHLENLSILIAKYASDVNLFSAGIKYYRDGIFNFPRIPRKYLNNFNVLDYFSVALISHGFVNASSVCCKTSSLMQHPFPLNMSNFEDSITWARICGSKGFAFSPSRTSIYVLNNNEGSSRIDFTNYINFKDIIYCIKDVSFFKLSSFLFLFTLFHLFHVKTKYTFSDFLSNSTKIIFKSFIVDFAILIAVITPAKLLSWAKRIRVA
jgi:glycosyltransferase involved in cell wall biosynthesis